MYLRHINIFIKFPTLIFYHRDINFTCEHIISMYSKETTRELQKLTTELIKKAITGSISKKDIEQLRNVLRFHEYRYYILNDPLIADYEYDQLYKALEKIETETPALKTADSPTQRVAKGLTKDFPTVQHLVPMLSLDNSYNSDDLIDFDRKAGN